MIAFVNCEIISLRIFLLWIFFVLFTILLLNENVFQVHRINLSKIIQYIRDIDDIN